MQSPDKHKANVEALNNGVTDGTYYSPKKMSRKDKGHTEKWYSLDVSSVELRVISPTIGQYSHLTELVCIH